MEMQYFKDYSPALGRDMECKIYGHAGRPMLYIPCQDGRSSILRTSTWPTPLPHGSMLVRSW